LLGRRIARVSGSHEVEAFWRVAGAWCPSAEPPQSLGLRLAERHRTQADAALANAGVRQPFTVIAPLAVGKIRGQSKQWPGFRLLARLLAERGPVVACPGPGEEAAMRAVLPDAIMCNNLGVGAYASVMAQSSVVVANDSGPMHLAAAVGAAVVGVFGVSDPGRTRPWSPRAQTVGDAGGWPAVDQVAAAALEAR